VDLAEPLAELFEVVVADPRNLPFASVSEASSDTAPEPRSRAAGGVVVRDLPSGREVAVVHRPRYDDWSLPKGKLRPGEGWEQAALREVREETGMTCELGEELAPARYRDRKGRLKLVRYWLMRPREGAFTPGTEVDELRWLEPGRAVELLDYPHDRELVESLDPHGGSCPGGSFP
jgi:8-oxo-dGTP diphosphatase